MNPSILSRAIQVIDAVSKSEQGLRFSEIATELDHPSPATVNKILKELVSQRILEKNDSGRYALGRKTYFWGRVMAAKNTPIQVIRTRMDQLHRDLRVSVNVFTCIDQRLFCLESLVDPESPALWQAGKSLPLHISILGAVFFIPDENLDDDLFLEREIARHDTELDLEDLKSMIAHARSTGFFDDRGQFFPGMYRLAVPLREKETTVMSLGLGVMPARLERNPQLYAQLTAGLQAAREEIESFLN